MRLLPRAVVLGSRLQLVIVLGLIVALASAAASFGPVTADAARRQTPSRVILYGDSLSSQAASYITGDLTDHGQARVVINALGGSAPCNWMPRMLREASAHHPRVVILEFSGNVACTGAQDGSTTFFRTYETQVTRVARAFASRGTRVFIIGAPLSLGSVLDADRQWDHLNEIYARIAARVPNTTFVNAGPSVSPHSQFTWTLPCRPEEAGCRSDGSILVRAYDGIHFCEQEAPGGSKCLDYSSGASRYAQAMTDPINAFLVGDNVADYVGQPLPPPRTVPTMAPGQGPNPYSSVHAAVSPHHPLFAGQSIQSVSGRYRATLENDGDFVLSGPTGVIWSTDTTGSAANVLTVLPDGNAALLSFRGKVHAVWTSRTAGTPANYLAMQDDGHLALYGADTLYWRSPG
jgi:hypothetical protein